MAFHAGFHFEFLIPDGTEGLEAVSARTGNLDLARFWVDILFHRKKICRFRLIRVSRGKVLSNGGTLGKRELLAKFSVPRSTYLPVRFATVLKFSFGFHRFAKVPGTYAQ